MSITRPAEDLKRTERILDTIRGSRLPAGHDEAAARAQWEREPALRAEFGDSLPRFLAYRRAVAEGRVRVLSRP